MKLRTRKIVSFIPFVLCITFILIASSCKKKNLGILNITSDPINFSVDNSAILMNGAHFEIKGIVYVPGYPGYLPWEIETSTSLTVNLEESINTDIANIKAMGANTIRFWGAPKYCYQALKNVGGLYFIQTIWIDSNQPNLHDPVFKETTRTYIRSVVDRIYSVYTDNNPPLVAYLVGNELSESSIQSTNSVHPEITKYTGSFISTGINVSASEAFLAEMADYVKTYEQGKYGNVSLVSYGNEIRTADLIDTPFLDFRSHNAYSYAVPYYRPNTQPGSSSNTLFQGWVEELKSRYPDMPLLISETGLSVSPNAQHIGPPNYGYGGNTAAEQASGIIQNINDIATAAHPIAGVCIHEYLDAWWKFGLEDSYSQDPDDIEEWFGIVRLIESDNWYSTDFRNAYYAIQENWTD